MTEVAGGRPPLPWTEIREVARGAATLVHDGPDPLDAPPGWPLLPLAELAGAAPLSGDVVIADLWLWQDPERVLADVWAAASGGRVIVVVPNVSRPTLVRRLVLGAGDAELPPPSPGGWFTRERLDRMAAASGWRAVEDARSTPRVDAATGRPFDDLLAAVGADAGVTDAPMLVRAYEPAEPSPAAPVDPFLTVLLRTQGRRPDALADVLLCLAAQTCADFEVLLLTHDVAEQQYAAIEALVGGYSAACRSRVHLVDVTGGGRSQPLIVGTQRATGRYVAVLDDDDLVTSDWVEVFREQTLLAPGTIVRSLVAEQSLEAVGTGAATTFRPSTRPARNWEDTFSLVSHVVDNHSPVHSYAYPREVFTEFGLSFDPDLPVLEDWDLLVRAASLVGVSDAGRITCIYRRFPASESSFAHLPETQWPATAWDVVRGWDTRPLLLPQGSASRLRADGIWLLRHRPLRARLRDRLERSSGRWSYAVMGTPLGRPARAGYRYLKRRLLPP